MSVQLLAARAQASGVVGVAGGAAVGVGVGFPPLSMGQRWVGPPPPQLPLGLILHSLRVFGSSGRRVYELSHCAAERAKHHTGGLSSRVLVQPLVARAQASGVVGAAIGAAVGVGAGAGAGVDAGHRPLHLQLQSFNWQVGGLPIESITIAIIESSVSKLEVVAVFAHAMKARSIPGASHTTMVFRVFDPEWKHARLSDPLAHARW